MKEGETVGVSEVRVVLILALLVAGYVLAAGVFVQKVVAPLVSDGETPAGFIPELDSGTFHEMAVEMSEDIRAKGWEQWELDPGWSANQPVGIMAAIYSVTGPSPLYLLPLNALLHALSVVLLYGILRTCRFSWRESFAGVLPFAFFPSTLTWVAQFHKDGIYCLGLFSLFYGSLLVLDSGNGRRKVFGFIFLLVGGALVSVVRDYAIIVFVAAAGSTGMLVQVIFSRRSRAGYRESAVGLLILGVALILILPLSGEKGGEGKGEAVTESPQPGGSASAEESPRPVVLEERDDYTPPPTHWVRSPWMPRVVDDQIHQLIHNRNIFIWLFPEATSYVDQDQEFQSAWDVIAYIPRALVVGCLAPFPDQWYDSRTTLSGNLQRMVSGVEMAVSYILLGCGLIFVVRHPSKAFFFLGITALLMILVLVYPLPAVGSLYRIRFGPYSILLAIGAASLIRYWITSRTSKN
ncbi:MAG: hypothetical protein ACQKBT_04580 [Puniceicoccales bacterium]